MSHARLRSGFTLIELLVVLSIIGLLAAIILPAVRSSRETARKAECGNHLKQMTTALANFESVHRHFPTAMTPIDLSASTLKGFGPLSVHYQLLPFLEQKAIFDSINYDPRQNQPTSQYNHPANRTAIRTRIAAFLCPSDRHSGTVGNNYRANLGPNPYEFEESEFPGGGGAFKMLRHTQPSDFSDGMSHTVGFSERIVGFGMSNSYDRKRDLWFTGLESIKKSVTSDELIEICGIAVARPLNFHENLGTFWLPGIYAHTVYNHAMTPNSKIPDCSIGIKQSDPDVFTGATVTARSLHPGMIHAAYMDGSVRAVKDSITLEVWRAISTRAGKESNVNY